jgi:hypothetical protein
VKRSDPMPLDIYRQTAGQPYSHVAAGRLTADR